MDTYKVCEIDGHGKPTHVRASCFDLTSAYAVQLDILKRSPGLPIRTFTHEQFISVQRKKMPFVLNHSTSTFDRLNMRRQMSHREMGSYVKTLTLKLSAHYNYNISVKIHKGKRTYCKKCGDPNTRITYGLQTLYREFVRGMNEYKTLKWVWKREGIIKGKKSLWAIALHEFAHVLQQDRARGQMHTPDFVHALQELISQFPYDEYKNLL